MDFLQGDGLMPFVFVLALSLSLVLELLAVMVTGIGYAVYRGALWLWDRDRA